MTTKSKRALVTGASEGIGRSFALKLAKRGYTVTAVARNGARLDSLVREMDELGGGRGHRTIVADLATEAGVAAVVKEMSASERYALLVNNAGFGIVGEFAETPIERTREMIAVNVGALVDLSHAFLQRAERGDAIIQVSSTLSFLPMPISAVYAATKAFVTSFSESLWYSCRKKGVFIENLCPGNTITRFADRAGWRKEEVPAWASQTADVVVENALRALERRSGPTVVSGWMNKVGAFLSRVLTRKMIVKLTGGARKDPKPA